MSPRSLPPFRFPLGLLHSLGRVRVVFLVPCLSSSCLLPAPQEGADVGLKEVKSTSAALLWSLVIQKANWGESTGKKREEEKPQETFCTIPRNREAFRQATAIPLKPETWRCTGPPSGAGERSRSGPAGHGFPSSHHSLGAKPGPRISGARRPPVARGGIAKQPQYSR